MPTFSNAGGSLGSAIVLTLLAWGVRWVRAELGRKKQQDADEASATSQVLKMSPYHARVGVKALMGLLETRACKFLLVDVRPFVDADFVDGTLGIGDTDVNGSLLPVTPRILSPRLNARLDRESAGHGTVGGGGVTVDRIDTNGTDGADGADGTNGTDGVKRAEDTGQKDSSTPGRRENTLQKTMSLPREFRGAIRLPYDLVGDVLSSKVAWEATFPHVKCPDTFTILVLLGENEEQECRAAARLNALGYQRSLCVKGSIHALLREENDEDKGFGKGPDVTYVSRDGLAMLLGSSRMAAPSWGQTYGNMEVVSSLVSPISESSMNGDLGVHGGGEAVSPGQHDANSDFVLVDVRRKDEVILYGAIHGARNIPVDQLASALSSDTTNAEFQQQYHFPKPDKNKLLVFCSRAFSRATWAAHVAVDAGYSRVCVYASGVCGWKLDPAVAGYPSYGLGDAPPSPISSEREAVDHQRGYAELADLLVRNGLGT
mmetsp:Transcript_10766/g.30003  ORF Transcript_10766/g.30003 Transcript_10766/m.30003 type:complete len:488 (+) Transcript_10766:117-1580(+)